MTTTSVTRPPTAARGPVPPALGARRRRHRLRVLAFLSPWLIGFAVFLVYPLVTTVYLSFTNANLVSAAGWVGLRNYRFLLEQDPYIWQAFRNTAWLVVVMVPAQVLFALAVAMLLVRLKSGAGLLRTVFYLPSLVPPVAATVAFVYMFNPATGPVNHILETVGIPGPDWFNSPSWSKPALTLLSLWGIGNVMVIFLAALLEVPTELYEAASLDGASPWQRFRYVTFPSISPVLLFSVVTGIIAALQYFTQAMVAAQAAGGLHSGAVPGYPEGSTLTVPQWLYITGFNQFHMGYACALAVVLFAVSMVFTAALLRRASGFQPQEVAS
ncbi:carbohydrate ABC transporter permease [Wenjunlia tyrosinilytica]|uniref:Sugar ABC transporter permease n=1 Tax=Wenjunlia tyrosinilytica TaxID=1544741 RepID=A0A917ZU36_9ACTN|nr:sugar ABC transporter permease [Wenjunlia tyrosinilytica]GGO91696.1 sugar ABC transporter permease [Wenjunlia tyrosinilytica]